MTKSKVKKATETCDVWTSNNQTAWGSGTAGHKIAAIVYPKSVLSLARPNFLTGAELGRSWKLGSRPIPSQSNARATVLNFYGKRLFSTDGLARYTLATVLNFYERRLFSTEEHDFYGRACSISRER